LWIISNPPACKVAINGEPRGETDAKGELQVNLTPATYNLRLSRDGYVTSVENVEVTSALGSQQEVEFSLAPALAMLNIVTDPAGAEVYLDDMYKGTSNSNGLLVLDSLNPAQPHKLRITKPGYTPQTDVPVTTYSGQISVRLLQDSVRVRVTTDPPDAEVYIDDVYKGASTSDGLLTVDQVNPNQSHRVRGKKAGYLEQIRVLSPNNLEVSIKLLPDPVVLLVKDIKQQIAETSLHKAFEEYNQLTVDAPEHPELPRLLESILQSLQSRSTDSLKRIEPFGLAIEVNEADEMKKLYDQARRWRPGDDIIETFGKYWDMKLALTKADQISSTPEKEALRRNAKSLLSDLSQRNMRNMNLLLEFGWAWLKLNDPLKAQKNFSSAQELKPDWSYPYFASAVLAMQAGDRELNKKSKSMKYGEAINSFTKAIELKRDFSRAYALRAIAYAYMKNYPESTASGLQAITIDPTSAYAHFALGFAYFQKGGKAAYRSARDEFERALALDGVELDQGTKSSIQERLAIIQRKIK
jgi:tetratricopeptide (TPR) repeat protein